MITTSDEVLAQYPKSAGEEVRLTRTNYHGKSYIDIRVFYPDDDGTMKPSKKGLRLSPDIAHDLATAVVDATA